MHVFRAAAARQTDWTVCANVRTDKIEAHFDKGVLTITLPKTEEAKTKTRKIPVSASSKVKRLHKKAA